MRPSGIMTLTTDFGSDGPYVAAMKGIVLGLAAEARIVDVSHAIAPQNIMEGAFVLSEIVDAFPSGTVHVGVVDPGVGTERRLIVVEAAEQWFVVPDNGLISGVIRTREATGVWEIANPSLRRPRVSSTFHGRDILAPAAAHLLNGGSPADFGPTLGTLVRLRNLEPLADGRDLIGEVIFRDAFGNLITNVSASHLGEDLNEAWSVDIAGERIAAIGRTYGMHGIGDLIALIGSTGWLEIAVVNGDAARQLSVGPGTTVRVRKTSVGTEPSS